jgi:MEMO1 family protein
MTVRNCVHAGSWYASDSTTLNQQLGQFLDQANTVIRKTKAIIAPHAGFRFSGPTAGFAYKTIDPDLIDTVILLGPSHKVWLDSCSLSRCDYYKTPFGNISIDINGFEILTRGQSSQIHRLVYGNGSICRRK